MTVAFRLTVVSEGQRLPFSVDKSMKKHRLAGPSAGMLPQPVEDEVATIRCLHGVMLSTTKAPAQRRISQTDNKAVATY